MSGGKLTVYVPCDVATVRVRLGYQETLTPIEQVVLKAVHAGAATLSSLCDALGMSRRLTLDVVQDLWRTGYLRLINSYAGLEVTAEVARHITQGTLAQLRSAETLVDDRKIMVDKLCGYVLPAQGPARPEKPRLAVPVENSAVRIAAADRADLLDAIERDLAYEGRPRRGETEGRPADTRQRRVLGVYLAEARDRGGGRRWMPLEIQAAVDPDHDQLVVSVIDTRLPEAYRTRATRQLTRLVMSRPKDPFVQALRGQVAPGLLSAPSLARAVSSLRERAATAATIPAGKRGDWHRQLSAQYKHVQNMIDARAGNEVTARVVAGTEHSEALSQLIRSARAQLVIACPWIGYDALRAILPDLRAALKSRVRLVLLWGIGYQDTLDSRVANLLYDTALRSRASMPETLIADDAPDSATEVSAAPGEGPPPGGAEGGPWFLLPDTAARTHAKVVVADDRAALVTSWNLLNRVEPSHEVGVHVTAPAADGTGSPVVREILRWARTAVPGYAMSRLMLVSERDFAASTPGGTQPWLARRPRYPDAPDAPGEGIDDAAGHAALQWARGWEYVAEQVATRLAERTHPPAEVVLDGAHRQVLWNALRDARERLVISSDRLSGQVLDARMLDALRKAAARDVDITIRYGRPDDRERRLHPDGTHLSTAPTPAEEALRDLAAEYPETVRVVRGDNHAKVLVWDDETVVSSFNFLSFEGSYDSVAAHRQHSELGLRLAGRAAANDVARAIGVPVADAPPAETAPPAPEYDATYGIAQRILTEVSAGADPAAVIAQHLAGDGALPWEILDRLAQNADRSLLRVVAAHCLSGHAATAPPGRRDLWLRWLVEDFWVDARYREAALLRTLVEDDGFAPGRETTRLAAARGLSVYSDVLYEVWSAVVGAASAAEDTEPGNSMTASSVALVATMEQVLFAGGEQASVMLDLGRDLLSPEWRPLADAIVAYAEASYHRPVPLTRIRSGLDRHEQLAEQARLWQRLDDAFERAMHTPLANSHSTRTLRELLDEEKGGVFARLAGRVRTRDIQEIAERLGPELPGGKDLDRLIDDASHAVDQSKEPIHGDHRRRLVRQLTSITANVRTLVATYRDSGGLGVPADVDEARHLAAARELAAVVKDELPGLISAAEATVKPEGRLIRELLGGLMVLREWAELRPEVGAGGVE